MLNRSGYLNTWSTNTGNLGSWQFSPGAFFQDIPSLALSREGSKLAYWREDAAHLALYTSEGLPLGALNYSSWVLRYPSFSPAGH